MDHLSEWADYPCPWALQEEPSIGKDDEESRFTHRPDQGWKTSDQKAGYYFKESFWSWCHHTNYESLDNYSAGNSFGDLPHVDASTRLYYLRYSHGNKGPDHPNIRRSNEPIHEKSKFNILRNPTDSRKRMGHWDKSDLREKPTELEKAANKLHWFPQDSNRPTNAPLQLCPGHTFKRPGNGQENSALVKFMAIPEMRDAVVDLLPYEDLSSVSRTSQACFRTIQASFTRWDMSNRNFGNANYSPGDLREMVEAGGELAEKAHSIMRNGPAPLSRLIVSPVRTNKERSFRYKGNALEQMFRGIVLFGERIRYLQLHRVEFLNAEAIDHMVDCMGSLKRLSVLQCPLIHFGNTKKLVDITARVNKARVPGEQMDLDFYPMAYLGPLRGRHGSHHVLFQDDGIVDTRIAVVACLTTIIPYARKHGVELAMPGRAFRLWLDGFPFKYGTLEKILESIDNLEHHTPQEEQRIVDQAREEGLIRDDTHEMTLRRRLQDALNYDLYIATKGEPQGKAFMESLEYNRCSKCGKGLLAQYFRSISASADQRVCHGCDLVHLLRNRQYHNHLVKRNELAQRILTKCNINCLAGLMINTADEKTRATKTWDSVLKGAKALDDTIRRPQGCPRNMSLRCYKTIHGVQHGAPNDRPLAACWDRERREFNLLLQTERGVIVNRGPHMGLNPKSWL